jgi:hypothetical protein
MKAFRIILFIYLSFSAFVQVSFSQSLERTLLVWDKKVVEIGPVLEEIGEAIVEFKGKNTSNFPVRITDVIPDCGCTTVDYSADTILPGGMGIIKVKFDAENKGGLFKKQIVVRTSLDIYGDTLQFLGNHFPIVESPEKSYTVKNGDLGLRLGVINFGDVFQNEPKTKYVEVYNFGKQVIEFSREQKKLPKHLKFKVSSSSILPNHRAILELEYDGNLKNDLGIFEENLEIESVDGKRFSFPIVANVYEYYAPTPKSRINEVAKIGISETEIDLREISSRQTVEKVIYLSNLGNENLLIKKLLPNCDCLNLSLDKKELKPGENTKLFVSFDPKGRKGIDYRNITIFSNDPLFPVRTIVIRSSVK